MINTHLDYVKDGPNRLERGVPVADVLATEEKIRLSSVDKLLPSATGLLDKGCPVLFAGDLNEPSHLDGPVAWPVSKALVGAGLLDAYREAHPDVAAHPGNTWGGVAGTKGSPRRIDYAYVGGPVEIRSSEVVGEQADSVDRGYPKWTSDHRAVLSKLTLTPVPTPTTIALSSRMVTVGDDVTAYLPDAEGLTAAPGQTERPVLRVVRRHRRVGRRQGEDRQSSLLGATRSSSSTVTATSSRPTSSTCDPRPPRST